MDDVSGLMLACLEAGGGASPPRNTQARSQAPSKHATNRSPTERSPPPGAQPPPRAPAGHVGPSGRCAEFLRLVLTYYSEYYYSGVLPWYCGIFLQRSFTRPSCRTADCARSTITAGCERRRAAALASERARSTSPRCAVARLFRRAGLSRRCFAYDVGLQIMLLRRVI